MVGPPSDVFSLGAVLTFAVTGEGPFGEGSAPALVYRVVHQLPDLTQLPGQIRPLVERCLAKEPSGGRPPRTCWPRSDRTNQPQAGCRIRSPRSSAGTSRLRQAFPGRRR